MLVFLMALPAVPVLSIVLRLLAVAGAQKGWVLAEAREQVVLAVLEAVVAGDRHLPALVQVILVVIPRQKATLVVTLLQLERVIMAEAAAEVVLLRVLLREEVLE